MNLPVGNRLSTTQGSFNTHVGPMPGRMRFLGGPAGWTRQIGAWDWHRVALDADQAVAIIDQTTNGRVSAQTGVRGETLRRCSQRAAGRCEAASGDAGVRSAGPVRGYAVPAGAPREGRRKGTGFAR
jgi:hypothetical protein